MKAVTREQWLNLALDATRKLFAAKGCAAVPTDARVSFGFPGGGSARKRIGECWTRKMSSVGVNEIFISPVLTDQFKMVEVLVHEAVHAADDCASGHKKFFRTTAKAVGLEGKMTATHAGAELSAWIKATVERLPKIEHGSLNFGARTKQKTLMLKIECPDCGCILRGTLKALNCGMPTCGCGTEMVLA
jgi:hypothetical protein